MKIISGNKNIINIRLENYTKESESLVLKKQQQVNL